MFRDKCSIYTESIIFLKKVHSIIKINYEIIDNKISIHYYQVQIQSKHTTTKYKTLSSNTQHYIKYT